MVIALPIKTSWGMSPVVELDLLRIAYSTSGRALGHYSPVVIIVFVNFPLMVEFILST